MCELRARRLEAGYVLKSGLSASVDKGSQTGIPTLRWACLVCLGETKGQSPFRDSRTVDILAARAT